MHAILLSAFNVVLGFILRAEIVKFVLFFALFYIASEFIRFITGCGCMPSVPAITNGLNAIPSGVKFFLDLFYIQQGLTTIFCAWAVRFLVRRLPIFG